MVQVRITGFPRRHRGILQRRARPPRHPRPTSARVKQPSRVVLICLPKNLVFFFYMALLFVRSCGNDRYIVSPYAGPWRTLRGVPTNPALCPSMDWLR
ncbi:hypothetical protein IscW_ISCW019750 [Ixodes scapularis]|uniref:Uncharacterized protein n=1 Tax=Ixodes scapularis TaxID=6945 RepID=B7PU85_IXOSC|nr:hypothetical protein IscW_ISCW019750 [Ixodes scapularis]|eukprot:XP_002405717.1 hypothetical protein IscW_ISCW019750 [Ixodes scapularis]